ncbi:MAG: ankyrin repeat domain-containing protein, partial [Puniceicoccales bacterium]|nr:ankyrin repeat domain-containing protein [Puniceicoccales bacterium]
MDAKGWLIRMGWVVLCSTGLALASESEHSSEEEKHSEEAKHLDSGEDSNDLVLPLSVDLAPLYSALSQKVRDFAEGKSPADGKCQRHLTEILKAFLLNIPEEEPSTSDQEVLTLSTLRNEESRNRLNNAQRGELFPIAKKFKEKFSLEELHRMDIDFERFREINLLYSMPLERPLTSEEESLLNKATWALDPSPEQRIWNAIAAVEDGFKTPEEAFEILKSAVEEGNVDIISPYKPITYVNRSSFLRLAAELEENKGLEIARFLLDHGADANMSDDIEWAIHSALRHENIEIVRLLIDHGTSEEAKYLDSDGDSDVLPPSEDLAPLYSALSQKVRDFAEGKSPADGKYQRHLTESLKAFLLNTSEEVLSTSDQEVPAPSTLHNEESRNRLNNGQCGELFPIAKEFKEKFSSEELHQMDIDFERFREINLLCSLSPGRPHTSEEKSLLVKVISALDPSPEQRIRDAIDAVEDGA